MLIGKLINITTRQHLIYIFEKIVIIFNRFFSIINFSLFNLAFGGEYTLFAGLEECLKFVRDYKLHSTDIEYLRTILPTYVEDEYFEYLAQLDMHDIKIYAVPEGKDSRGKSGSMRIHRIRFSPLAEICL
jgi:nicotinic acid phosphoribosyltransferase